MIRIRRHNEYAKSASLQGIKIEMKQIRRTFEPISQKVKNDFAKLHQDAIKRKFAEKNKGLMNNE